MSGVRLGVDLRIEAGANQPVHWFLGGKGLGIQGMSVWVGSPKSKN